MANKNEAEGALQRVLEELVTEFRGFSRTFSGNKAGATGQGWGQGGGQGGAIGGIASAIGGGVAGAAASAVGLAAKTASKLAKETGFRFATNRIRFGGQESGASSFSEAAFQALGNAPIIGGAFARGQGTIDRATQRTKAIVGDIARASGKVDEERTAELSDFLLDRFKGEETAAQKSGEIVDKQARQVFQSTRQDAYDSPEGQALLTLVNKLDFLIIDFNKIGQTLGLRD
jgi:hypothetical protein